MPERIKAHTRIDLAVDQRLLDILCCPATRQPLALASERDLEAINAAIRAGSVDTISDARCSTPLASALITRDRKLIYPVEDGIPVLLPERAISANAITDFPA